MKRRTIARGILWTALCVGCVWIIETAHTWTGAYVWELRDDIRIFALAFLVTSVGWWVYRGVSEYRRYRLHQQQRARRAEDDAAFDPATRRLE